MQKLFWIFFSNCAPLWRWHPSLSVHVCVCVYLCIYTIYAKHVFLSSVSIGNTFYFYPRFFHDRIVWTYLNRTNSAFFKLFCTIFILIATYCCSPFTQSFSILIILITKGKHFLFPVSRLWRNFIIWSCLPCCVCVCNATIIWL